MNKKTGLINQIILSAFLAALSACGLPGALEGLDDINDGFDDISRSQCIYATSRVNELETELAGTSLTTEERTSKESSLAYNRDLQAITCGSLLVDD